MLTNLSVRAEANGRWTLRTPMSLIRPDRARPIDQIIDYFGGAPRRTTSVVLFPARPVRWGDDDQTRPPQALAPDKGE
jgi:hypothetical protein